MNLASFAVLKDEIIDAIGEGILVYNEHGNILLANNAASQMLGWRVDEIVGQQIATVIGPAVGNGAKPCQVSGEEHRVTDARSFGRQDGTTFPVEYTISPLRKGDMGGTVITFKDISGRRKLENQLCQAQKMESLGLLAGGVAHDFNNLLTIIQGYSKLLNEELSRLDKVPDALNQIQIATDRAAKLTRQLLAFSRKQTITARSLDLNGVITDILKMLNRVIGENIRLIFSPKDGLPQIQADTGMIEQVLMNLVINARDAMPRGGIISISTEVVNQHSPMICLTVRDTGTGMGTELQGQIFEPFFTTKQHGKGTGLGLATVKSIVDQHHGKMEVHSKVGEGTAFKIFFPALQRAGRANLRLLEAESEESHEWCFHPEETAPMALKRGHARILLVEDEPVLRGIFRISLEQYGYKVLEASTGAQALAHWRAVGGDIDLLLTDLVLSDEMTGQEIAERLQSENPNIQVIFVSGYSKDQLGQDVDHLRDAQFLQKPFKPQELLELMQSRLGRAAPVNGRNQRKTLRMREIRGL